MEFKLTGSDRLGPQYREFAQTQNVKMHKIFMLVLVFICLLLWVDNSDTIKPINLDVLLTYSNIAGAFTFLFLTKWLILMISAKYKTRQTITLWLGIFEIFAFVFCLGILDLQQGNGLLAPALGFLIVAVLFSARIPLMISIFLISGALFYYFALQLEGVTISNHRVSFLSIIILSIIIFITTEKQRRTVFITQKMLAGKIDELNHALDIKSVFVGHMSHELRTPLNAIIGFSDMILSDSYQPKTIEKIKEYTGFINSGGQHLLTIVNDLLDHTKIESGELAVVIEKINLNQVLQDYIDELGAVTLEKSLSVKLKINADPLIINSDKRLLKQIIFNLISNAQKFTPSGGQIEVFAAKSGNDQVDIRVKDNGKGMDKEMLMSVNDEEASLNTHYIARAEGTGLGLIIVRQLVQLLQGSIKFKSRREGGTEIRMSLPRHST